MSNSVTGPCLGNVCLLRAEAAPRILARECGFIGSRPVSGSMRFIHKMNPPNSIKFMAFSRGSKSWWFNWFSSLTWTEGWVVSRSWTRKVPWSE